jgi:hypothetical protein
MFVVGHNFTTPRVTFGFALHKMYCKYNTIFLCIYLYVRPTVAEILMTVCGGSLRVTASYRELQGSHFLKKINIKKVIAKI